MKRLKQKELNFLSVSRVKKEEKKCSGKKVAIILFPVILAALCLGAYAGLMVKGYFAEQQIDEDRNAISLLEKDSDYLKAQTVKDEITKIGAENEFAKIMKAALDTYPDLDDAFYTKLMEATGGAVSITELTYSASGGTLQLAGKATGVTGTADFVTRLRATGLFEKVEYSGYQAENGTNSYLFRITGVLKGKQVGTDEK